MSDISFPVAFVAGLLSFLSPCVLPLVPVYLANIAGTSVLTDTPPSRKYILLHTVFFIAGFSLIFIALGAAAGLLGGMIPRGLLEKIAGALLVAFGVFLLASTKIPWLNYETRLNLTAARGTGYLRSLSIGAIFALGWTPCVGPFIGSVIALAGNLQTVWQAIYLLLVYCIGLGLPFIIISLAISSATRPIRWLSRHSFATLIVGGALLIIIGILMLTGNLGYLSGI